MQYRRERPGIYHHRNRNRASVEHNLSPAARHLRRDRRVQVPPTLLRDHWREGRIVLAGLAFQLTPPSRYYSVPSRLIREIVASHARSPVRNRDTPIPEQPSAHRRCAEWTPARVLQGDRQRRSVHDRAQRGHHESKAASRAGLPLGSRHPCGWRRAMVRRASGQGAGVASISVRRSYSFIASIRTHRLNPWGRCSGQYVFSLNVLACWLLHRAI
jgi:hypothetical protein